MSDQPINSDDVKFESTNEDGETIVGDPETTIKRLKAKLKTCDAERLENLDGWQRAKADFANHKKREAEEKEWFVKFAQEALVTDLLPVLESFNQAFSNKAAWESVEPSWRKGVEYIHAQLTQVLVGHGLAVLRPIGETFDPKQHHAVGDRPTTETEKVGTIAEVTSAGYRFNGKLIKPPSVTVYEIEENLKP
jgi:molecular chaperone GrpE